MSLILPGNSVVNPIVETTKTQIGDFECEYFAKPGFAKVVQVQPGTEFMAIQGLCQLAGENNAMIHALIREIVELRDALGEAQGKIKALEEAVPPEIGWTP